MKSEVAESDGYHSGESTNKVAASSHPLPMWQPRRDATADQQTQQAFALSTDYQSLKPTRQPPSDHDSRHDGYAHVGMVVIDICFPDSGATKYLHDESGRHRQYRWQ